MEITKQQNRTNYFLNIRFILILLVVIANCIEPLIGQSRGMQMLFDSIYTFHIPMFVFVTGYFSKSFRFDSNGLKILKLIAYQYVIFQTLYSVLDHFLFHAPNVYYSFFMPYSLLWFLFSNFFWKVLLRLFNTFRHPIMVSILLGVVVGYIHGMGGWFSFSRTLVYFPFFLAGYYMDMNIIKINLNRIRWFAVCTGLMISVSLWLGWEIDLRWLYGSYTYGQIGHEEWYAGIYRFITYAFEGIASLGLLYLVPWKYSRMTEHGQHTLYVFLIHGLLVKTVLAFGLYKWIQTPLEIGYVLIGSFVLTWILSHSWVVSKAKTFIEPNLPELNLKPLGIRRRRL
jgi:fucose 4-O-acetylase-like acetyltransferase